MPVSYPNQWKVKIRKSVNKSKMYLSINKEYMLEAMKNLKPNTFKVFMYFASNKDGYEFYCSSAHIQEECGMSLNTAKAAKRELVDKGYLVQEGNNSYSFYELPSKQF